MNDQQNNRMTRDGEANAFILPVDIPCLAKEINQIRTEIYQAMRIPPNLLKNGERYLHPHWWNHHWWINRGMTAKSK